ncbi:chymotrypsin-elastase inhibitor ixodidin-like [Ixodes scapularis]
MKTLFMMAPIITLILALQGVVVQGSENAPTPEACGEGEVWKNCVGSSCAELTCEHPEPPNGCTKDCNYGCYCGEGYYRNSQEQCVTKEQCT